MSAPPITISKEAFTEFLQPTKAWIESMLKTNTKAVAPMVTILCRDVTGEHKLNVIQIRGDFNEAHVKNEVMQRIGAMVFDQELFPVAVSFVSEAWMSKIPKEEANKDVTIRVMPRNDPDRVEVIVFSAQDIKGQNKYICYYEIHRDSEDVISQVGETFENNDPEGVNFIIEELFKGFWNKGLDTFSKRSNN